MARYYLTRVAIEGFRGINNEGDPLVLSFKSDAVNSVFGLNGLGKSSIYDALAYAFKDTIPKFAELPAADAPGEYYTNRFHTGRKATIDLEFLPDDGGPAVKIRAERTAMGARSVTSSTGQADPDKFLRQFGVGTALMDYRAFGQFVDDTPLKRGRTFSGLLGLGLLSEYRQALETLANTRSVKGDFELETLTYKLRAAQTKERDANARIARSHKALLGTDVVATVNCDEIAKTLRSALKGIGVLSALVPSEEVEIDFAALRAAIKTAEGSTQRDRLAEVIKQHGVLDGFASSKDESNSQERVRELLGERDNALKATVGVAFQRLYEAGKAVVESPEWNTPNSCPLCESDNLDEPIAAHIDSHLKAYDTAIAAESQVRELWKTAPWAMRLLKLGQLLHSPGADEADIDRAFRAGIINDVMLDSAIVRLELLETERLAALALLQAERESLEKTLPPSLVAVTEQVEAAEQLAKALNDLQAASQETSSIAEILMRRERWATFIEKAANEFADAEVALSTAKTVALETEYKKLYQAVTRNPDVVPLLKKTQGSEELHLRLAKFYGLSDVSAATLLPESYRNALAVCIFLAAAYSGPS